MKRLLYLYVISTLTLAACSSEKDKPDPGPGPGPSPSEDIVLKTVEAVSSSSINARWEGDFPESGLTLYLYSDEACSQILKSIKIEQAANGLTFGGLTSGTTYWIKLANGGELSEAMSATTSDYSPIPVKTEITGPGELLAEDFSEFSFGPDPLEGSAGLTKDGNNVIAASGSAGSLKDYPEDKAASRLASWQTEFYGVDENSIHPGYIKIGSDIAGAWIGTPPFTIEEGKKVEVTVRLKAARLSEDDNAEWALFVMQAGPVQDWPDASDNSRYREISFSGAGQWENFRVDGLTLTDGESLVFGRKQKTPTISGVHAQVLLSEISVNALEASDFKATLSGVTSSTLSFSWEGTPSSEYNATLFSDPQGSIPVQSVTVNTQNFIFSGLESGTTYYLRVLDNDGLSSGLLEASTLPFSVITMPEEVTEAGVILAENFSELRWEADPITKSAGYRPESYDSFSNGPGTIVPSGTEPEQQLKLLSTALASSRLKNWAIDSYAYVRPGAIGLGGPAKKGWLLTPEIPLNVASVKVNVTLKVASMGNIGANVWCIGVLDQANANVTGNSADFDHHPDEGEMTKIQTFTLNPALTWQTITAKGLIVGPGDRIFFGIKGGYSVSGNNCRALVDELSIEAVTVYTLENPLVFVDGSPVSNSSDWDLRRNEILNIFQHNVYGLLPEKLPIYPEVIESGQTSVGGQPAVRTQIRMWFDAGQTGHHVDWLIVRPKNAVGKVPVIMTLNYVGNHSFLNDTQILIPDAWQENWPEYGVTDHKAQASGRGKSIVEGGKYYYPMQGFLSRGYAFVTACQAEISPDPEDPTATTPDRYGLLFELFGQRDPSKMDNTGALMLWAWTLMRGMDMIEGIEELDADKVIVTGGSRLGKAALIAGAFDNRFAIVAPVQSGGGGSPLSKHIATGKETIASETANYPHWWCKNFSQYAGKEETMPFDQHLLLSCVAPRGLLVGGFNYKWFDTEAEFFSVRAASPVWNLLGYEGMPDVYWPAVGSGAAIGSHLGYYRRAGNTAADHGVIMADWEQILSFSDNLVK